MNRVTLDRWRRVELVHRRTLPLSIQDAWDEMRDFARFACMDHFHRAVHFDGGEPRRGVALRLEHGIGPLRFLRFGRILSWREGRGWTFSDLGRDAKRGFPHVFDAQLTPLDSGSCRLDLAIRGKWTAAWAPRPLARLWLGWNLLKIGRSFDNALLRAALRRSLSYRRARA